jgi:hypothetical protein
MGISSCLLKCVVLNDVTSPTVDEPTKTIFEATYGQTPDYDALPSVWCYAVRFLKKQHRKDFRFDLTNQTGIFLGYATYNNIYGAVLFAEKALVVDRVQIAFDLNFFPLTDKSSDNPRFKFLHTLNDRDSYRVSFRMIVCMRTRLGGVIGLWVFSLWYGGFLV